MIAVETSVGKEKTQIKSSLHNQPLETLRNACMRKANSRKQKRRALETAKENKKGLFSFFKVRKD